MSHVTAINLFITDLDSLAKACERLGLELVKGQKTFKWYGRFVGDSPGIPGMKASDYGKCEHAIRVKGNKVAYEIGLIKRRDGKAGYELIWDNWAGGHGLCAKVMYENTLGKTRTAPNADKLKDWYAAEVSAKTMRRQGFRVNATQQGRKVKVVCSK
jgi:hypothetical protein